MNYLYERVSYLKGLCDGANISRETKEGLILHKIIEVLEDFADEIVELSNNHSDLEDIVYDLEDIATDSNNDFYDEDQEIICPSCGEEVFVEDDILYDENEDVFCPVCDEVILPGIKKKSEFENEFDIQG